MKTQVLLRNDLGKNEELAYLHSQQAATNCTLLFIDDFCTGKNGHSFRNFRPISSCFCSLIFFIRRRINNMQILLQQRKWNCQMLLKPWYKFVPQMVNFSELVTEYDKKDEFVPQKRFPFFIIPSCSTRMWYIMTLYDGRTDALIW